MFMCNMLILFYFIFNNIKQNNINNKIKMMCEYINEKLFTLKLRESCEYTHHRLEYNHKKIKLIRKEYIGEDDGLYIEYIFEILNNNPTKIKIKFDFNDKRVEYVNINKSECVIL